MNYSLAENSLNNIDSSLNETSEEILNPEVMEHDFDTRSETSDQHGQDILSGGGSELGILYMEYLILMLMLTWYT